MPASSAELRDLRDRVGREEYQRACRHAAWETGDLSYALNAPQLRLRDLWYSCRRRGVRRVVAKWARRVGKTRTCSVLAFESALRAKRRRILYAAQTQTAVREFVAPHFLALATDAPDHLRPELVGNEMRFRNGSRIVLQGCEDQLKADRLRGPEAHDAFIDEGGFIPVLGYVVRDVVRPQLATTGGAMLLASSPPEAPDHQFDEFAADAEARGAFIHYTVYDAAHLTADEIAQWCADVGGPDSIAWLREGLAKSVTDPRRAVLPEFSEFESVVVQDSYDRPEHCHKLIVGDLGYVDMTVVGFGFLDFERSTLVVEDEIAPRRPTSDVVHGLSAAKAHALWGEEAPLVRKLDGPLFTIADIANLERAELAADAEQIDRWQAVHNAELGQAVNALRVRIKRGKIVVLRRCTTIVAHARSARWNVARTSFERIVTDEGQHHYDGCAALVYMAREARKIEHRNPTPAIPPGVDYRTHRVPVELTGDARIERFRQISRRRERR